MTSALLFSMNTVLSLTSGVSIFLLHCYVLCKNLLGILLARIYMYSCIYFRYESFSPSTYA